MVNPFEERLRSREQPLVPAPSQQSVNPFAQRLKERTPYGPSDTSFLQSASKGEGETSIWQRTKDYFKQDKFGEALALQRKTGGFAGAPVLYPEQAAEVATEVATIGAVEAAFAPVMGWAAASQWAPKTISALSRLTQAATTGGAVATTKNLVKEGELPSQEELVKDAGTWVAIDAALQAAHIAAAGGKTAYDFGKAVNNIAKSEGVPPTQVLGKLWDSTKNYLGQRFGRNIKTPADILPADVEVLEQQAKQIESQLAPESSMEEMGIPEGEPSHAPEAEPQYSPEEQMITAPEKFLKSDYEMAQDIQKALSPLNVAEERPASTTPATVQSLFSPVKSELDSISPQRVTDPGFIGRETSRAVQRVSDQEYKETSRLWDEAKNLASDEIFPRPELVNSLRAIAEEAPARAAGGEAKLQNFAQDLIHKLEKRKGQRVGYRAMSNEQLIKEIQQARVGYDYRYSGGIQGHRINEFINAVEDELIRTSSPESRNALLRAREGTKNWATKFKDPNILPFRNKSLSNPQRNYNRSTNPDIYIILSGLIKEDPRGKHLLDLIRRNMIEKSLEPYLLRPQSFNPVKFERDMSKLQDIIPQDAMNAIGQRVYQNYVNVMNGVPGPHAKTPSFANINEAQITSKLGTIEGLRELKKQLSMVPGGKELYDQIAGTLGIDLLFGGQMNVPANSERIRKMINDRNGRPYIKETLGEDNLQVLDDLVRKNKLEKRLLEIKESPTLSSIVRDPDILIKGTKILWDVLRGNALSAATKIASLHKKVSKKTKPSDNKPQQDNINIR